jgi:prevent-host-death family protein
MNWQLQEAKQKFSEVVRQAENNGPQVVTRHGREVVVVLGAGEYHRLQGASLDFKAFLMGPPYIDDIDITRDRTPARVIDFSNLDE